jgi:hypothetical protein
VLASGNLVLKWAMPGSSWQRNLAVTWVCSRGIAFHRNSWFGVDGRGEFSSGRDGWAIWIRLGIRPVAGSRSEVVKGAVSGPSGHRPGLGVIALSDLAVFVDQLMVPDAEGSESAVDANALPAQSKAVVGMREPGVSWGAAGSGSARPLWLTFRRHVRGAACSRKVARLDADRSPGSVLREQKSIAAGGRAA